MAIPLKALQIQAEYLVASREVIRLISEGKSLAVALAEAKIPQQRFHEVLSKERMLSVDYARAQEIRADRLADEVVTIADDENIDPIRARNMIQARQWRAKTLNPKTYGERIDLNVTQTIDVLGTLNEARARIARSISDQQQDVIDVTPTESSVSDAQPTDDQSVTIAQGVPDIFS